MTQKRGPSITRRDGSTVHMPGREDLERMIEESGLGSLEVGAKSNPMNALAAMQRFAAMSGLGREVVIDEAKPVYPLNDESMEP